MTITVLKSKIENLEITKNTIINDGTIHLPEVLIEHAHLKEYEEVRVINTLNGNENILFIKKDNDVMVPNKLGGVGHRICIISTTKVTLDEDFKEPIIINSK